MALLIKADGTEEEVKGTDKGGKFGLNQLYQLLDCDMVQLLRLKLKYKDITYNEVWCDEEGKLNDKPVNAVATRLLGDQLFGGDYFVGHTLLVGARKKKTPQEHNWIQFDGESAFSNASCARCGVLRQKSMASTNYHIPGKGPLDWQKKRPACHPKESR